MTLVDHRDSLAPVYAIFTETNPSLDDCPADFDVTVSAFILPLPNYGNSAVVLDTTGKLTTPKGGNVFYRKTEEELMVTVAGMIQSVLGPECSDGSPAFTNMKLIGWNMTGEVWPTLCTKWFRYREACGSIPYRMMMQDPAMRWFSHACLLNVDAAYRQGRPVRRGFCEVDQTLTMRYLLNDDSIPAVTKPEMLEWLKRDPKEAMLTIEAWMNAMRDTVWYAYGRG